MYLSVGEIIEEDDDMKLYFFYFINLIKSKRRSFDCHIAT